MSNYFYSLAFLVEQHAISGPLLNFKLLILLDEVEKEDNQ